MYLEIVCANWSMAIFFLTWRFWASIIMQDCMRRPCWWCLLTHGVWLPWLLVEIFTSAIGSKTLMICILISVQDCDPIIFGSLSFPVKFTFLKGTHLTENELGSSRKSSQVVCENYGPRLSFLFSWFCEKYCGVFLFSFLMEITWDLFCSSCLFLVPHPTSLTGEF